MFSSTVDAVVAERARRAASRTGAIEYFARSSSVFGRPRCEQTRTSRAPRSSSSRSVGSDARMRVSSATRPSSSGTFRSDADEDDLAVDVGRLDGARQPHADAAWDEVDEPARVAPLVVVPAEDLREVAVRHRQLAVERARRRRMDDVGRDERLGRVLEVRRERPVARRRLERRVDLARRSPRPAASTTRSVTDPVGTGARIEMPSTLPLQVRQHEADRAGGAGRGRDQVDRGRAGAAQVLVRHVRAPAGRCVYAWIVVMKPRSIPNASSSTFAIGATQFVVHEAFEMIECCSRVVLVVVDARARA